MKPKGVIELAACTLEYACGERLESEGDQASFELARELPLVRAHLAKQIGDEQLPNPIEA
jgi:hypothetical protein